jgi:glycosyltransferase involved in cell wall biosynthesis
MRGTPNKHLRIGVFDHTGRNLGGGQLVAGYIAASLSRSYAVELIYDSREFTLGQLSSAFGLDLSRVSERIVGGVSDGFEILGRYNVFEQIRRSRELTECYDLFIYCGHSVPPFCHAKHGLVYCHFPMNPSPKIPWQASSRWVRRNRLDRLVRGAGYQLLWKIRMQGYRAILANSLFTARWVERRWDLPAEVVYPPVELTVPAVTKQNIIVSLGRFEGGSWESKHQLAQVSAFREFLTKVAGDWKMHLVGSCHSPQERAYLTSLQQAAEGLPVTFLVNAEREAVCTALAESKVFWHTKGLSNDDTEHPFEAEHFGIATVEAMRAGCVPIVMASGGQKEIMQDRVHGFLCKDLNELIENTVVVVGDECLCRTLSQQARRRSLAFTKEGFERRVAEIVSQCLNSRENGPGSFHRVASPEPVAVLPGGMGHRKIGRG